MTIDTFLYDLARYLEDHNFGVQGESIFIDGFESSEDGLSLNPYTGPNIQWVKSTEDNPHNPFLQVLIRNTSRKQARKIAFDIYSLLRRRRLLIIGNTNFFSIEARGTPIPLGLTKNLSFEYSVNFSLVIQ